MAHSAITLLSTRPACRTGGVASRVLPRLAGAARFFAGALNFQRACKKALLVSSLCLLSSAVWGATPPNTPISNTATATYQLGAASLTASGTVSVNTAACVAVSVKIDLMQYIPPARAAQVPGAANELVQPGTYSTSGLAAGPYAALANPVLFGDTAATALPATLLLAPINDTLGNKLLSYSRNEPVFIRVTSYDANVNPAAADTVSITLTTTIGGDSEVVQLMETGLSTGVFVGVVPTQFAAIGTSPVANDGSITISAHNETITGVYSHSDCSTGASIANSSSGLIDPYGIVFDSATGTPVSGATISLIDAATGLPATVYCDDSVTVLPQPVSSGSPTACDAAMAPGGFRFPQVAAGSYRIAIISPAGHNFPSNIAASGLPATIGTPPAVPVILGEPSPTPGGSYGGTFTLWGPALKVDIPLDPGSMTMTIQKSAGKTVVGTGDFVPYTLSINNNSAAPLANAQVADRLPPGFRYQKGSTRLNGASAPDPMISPDGHTLTFSLDLAASATATVRYVLEVTPAARAGAAENTAAATGGVSSNTARARVMVREDLYRNKAILAGRVIEGSCDTTTGDDKADGAKGLANARIVLQEGTYALTDSEGRWHIDNLRPGTHVVQLDLDSLPRDYEVAACGNNSRFAGRNYSQFVNVRGGSLWRADFYVKKKAPETVRITQTLSANAARGRNAVTLKLEGGAEITAYSATVILSSAAKYVPGSARLNGTAIADPDSAGGALIFRSKARPARWQDQYSFEVTGAANAAIKSLVRFTPPDRAARNLPVAEIELHGDAPASATTFAEVLVEAAPARLVETEVDDPAQLVEILPYDEAWLEAAQPGAEWLHPQESFLPALPAIKVAVKHAPGHSVRLSLNGEEVSPLYYDEAKTNAAKTVMLATWRGIHIRENDNQLELVVTDASGKEVLRQTRNIRYTVTPDRVELVREHSRLIADGKTRPVIAVRFLDKDGYRMRRGINGEFILNEPYRSYDRREGIDREPLAGRLGGKPRYEVRSDGLAMIELEPTTQTGEAVLNFQFNDQRTQEIRAWLEPGQRDWILVGFGEGTLGHKTLSGNVEELRATDADRELFDGNKLALYAKGSIRGDYLLTIAYDTAKETGNPVLKQAIDPTQYYTLYADATQASFDAASSSRLYLKLERRQFYAMFGDYDTGLTVTELSRYSRTLNGVKSEYKGETFGYNTFATVTAQAYIKDEIPGNGTSGVYKLSRGNLMVNSDKVRIETRDRFQSQNIVSTQTMTRYLDYDIDYYNGTLTFREPVVSRDGSFNPTYIVAEYESADPADEKATMGGRASFKPLNEIEVGASLVHEGTVGATGDLKGLDLTYQPDEKNKVRAEVAATSRDLADVSSGGNAWLGEVTHHEEKWDAKAYVRDQGSAFGMGQQAASESATRKMGVDGRYKLSEITQLQGQAYQQENLTSGAQNSVVEGRVDNRIGSDLSAYYGARSTQDQSAAGSMQSNQLLGGAAYTMLDKRLTLRGTAEVSGGMAGSSTMPDRLILGTDYKVTEQSKLFAEQEFARGEQVSANTTRAGIRTQPWTGNEMSASVGNNINNDAERLYANLGMVQRWQITEHWQTNFSVDRSQTLHNTAAPLNLDTPLPSGSGGIAQLPSASGDYSAASASLAYHDKVWSSDGRIEVRNSTLDRQRNLLLGLQRNLDNGRAVAGGYTLRQTESAASSTRDAGLRLSWAHRPNDSQWMWFDRADFLTQTTRNASSTLNGAKLVNNLNANYMPTRDMQIALQYGAKYVKEAIDGTDYKGYTDLTGVEVRRDLTHKWDVGAFGSVMRSLNAGVRSYGLGASVGYNVVDNIWLSVGYNARGMDDRDFAAGSYRAQGPYLTLRFKVDQDTFGLNKGAGIVSPVTAND